MSERPKATVLAVDDTPENLDVVKGILTPEYMVKAALNGEVALRIARKKPPDLVLLDIMMPGMSGYEVCAQLKSDPVTSDIPVIFLTAMDQTTDEAKGFELGAADYITKPVNPPILEARVRTHVALKRAMDDLQDAYRVIKKQKDRMQLELDAGHEIQMSMLPEASPTFGNRSEFDLFASLKPAREVGGDFYDYFFLNDDELCVVVGDVSGKGVPASLFMAVTQTMIKTAARGDQSPASILTRVNEALSSDNPSCMFVTLFLAIVNVRSGRLIYSNAGHNPPYIVGRDGRITGLEQRHGLVLGAMTGLAYRESEGSLAKGDSLFVFTDGVTEAMDTQGALFGESRLEESLILKIPSEARTLTESVLASVEGFSSGALQADDITTLCFTLKELPATDSFESVNLTLKADLSEMAQMQESVQEFAATTSLPAGVMRKVNIILDELLNNTISYGFEDPAGHEIDVRLELGDETLTLRISDDGVPFNPFVISDPDTSLSIEDRKIGGLGVMLVKRLTENQQYERLSGRNVVTLTMGLSD